MITPMVEKESPEEADHPHVDVPGRTRFLWGLGGFADATITYGPVSNVSVIYVNALGYGAAMVNLACAVPRLFDAISDSIIGHLSDNTRSRWGRRRPWMFVGLMVAAALGILIWHPPDMSRSGWNWGMFAYLAVMMSLLYAVGYSFFSIPHIAMGYEMTTDYNERTHLFKWRQLAFAAAGFLTPWFLPLSMWLEGPRSQQLKGSQGMITVSILVAAIILLTGLPSVFFCKEKVAAHKDENKVRFFDAAKMTLHNKPFWLLVVSNIITKFCMAVTGIFFVYIFLYHVGPSADQKVGSAYLAVFFNTINIVCFLAMAPVAALTDRIGKKPALLLMLAMSAVAYLSLWFTFTNAPASYFHFVMPWGSSLSLQWPCLITAALIGIFTNTMPMINNSMLADVCDLDELTSGHRREAFYGAVFITTDKIALAVALGLQGVLLVASGFDAGLEQQTWGTIRYWLLALVITQPIGFLIGLVSIFIYPLTRGRCHEITSQLNARRNAKVTA